MWYTNTYKISTDMAADEVFFVYKTCLGEQAVVTNDMYSREIEITSTNITGVNINSNYLSTESMIFIVSATRADMNKSHNI